MSELSDEEKIKNVQQMFEDIPIKDIESQSITIYGTAILDVIEILNLIEKQSKEIEELKENNTELKRTYLRTAKHQENIGHIELAHYMLAQIQACPTFTTWEDYKTWVDKDKIKAKMKEEEWALKNYDSDESDSKQSQAIGAWVALQSLLGEE